MMILRRAKETLFGMQFVMTDGQSRNDGNPMRRLVILYVIDVLQVFRVMLSSGYGWTPQTYSMGKHVDMVYNVTTLLSFIVPRYAFFGLAFLMVAFALCDAFYCARLFKAGEIHQIGPIKALRFMVAVVVTTLFSSVMKWLLIPFDCLISGESNYSAFFHGEGAPCTPLAFPEFLTTVPTIILVIIYVLFALTVAFFSLGTNPLSCAPHVQFTGRVEALFILTKVCSTFLPFLSEFLTPVAISTILLALCGAVWYRHLCVMPFHSIATNMLRGGIYFSMLWLSLSSVLVSTLATLEVGSEHARQTMQWLLVGCTPVAFPVGIFMVWRRRNTLSFFIDRLRGEFETHSTTVAGAVERDAGKNSSNLATRARDMDENDGEKGTSTSHSEESNAAWRTVGTVGAVSKPRGALQHFFNPSWERKRAFASAQDALTTIRTLLMRRSVAELPFLRYMVSRAIDEHPDSLELQVLNVSLLRFVFTQTSESSQAEKKLRNSHATLAVDHEYVLYAVERKAAQDYAAISIGNGAFNAINLMEFDSGMQQARSAHVQCLVELRKFWAVASGTKTTKEKDALQIAVDRLVDFNRCVARAVVEYQALLDKYPQSAQLIGAYCSFCDTVLNDPMQASELRKQAAALQDDEDDTPEIEARLADSRLQATLEQRSQRSGSVLDSEVDDHRIRIQKTFSSWSAAIFGPETNQLLSVSFRLKICFGLLLLCSTVGFAVIQWFLFKSYAQRDSHLINQTGLLRTLSVNSLFFLRSQMMAAWRGDTETFQKLGDEMTAQAKRFQVQHWANYELARTARVTTFYSDVNKHGIRLHVPGSTGWKVQETSFWNFGTDWARRMDRAATATIDELKSPVYDIRDSVPESKLNIIFLNENAFRVGVPTLEEAVLVYESEMKNLWSLTQTIVLSNTGAVLLVLAVLLYLVVFRLIRIMGSLQHLYLACHLAHVLPHATTRKIAKFYEQAEQDARCIDDEEAMKRLIEKSDDDRYDEASNEGPTKANEEQTKAKETEDVASRSPRRDRHLSKSRRTSLPTSSSLREPALLSLNEFNVNQWAEQNQRSPALRRRVSLPSFPKAGNRAEYRMSSKYEVESETELTLDTSEQLGVEECDRQAVAAYQVDDLEVETYEDQDKTTSMKARCDRKGRYEGLLGEKGKSEVEVVQPNDVDAMTFNCVDSDEKPPDAIPALCTTTPKENQAEEPFSPAISPLAGPASKEHLAPETSMSWRGGAVATEKQGKSMLDSFGGILRRAGSGNWKKPKMVFQGDSLDPQKEDVGSERGADNESDRLPLREVSEERATQIWECVRKHEPFSARTSVWLVSMAVIVGLSMLLNWFPARRMGTLVTLAPTINQAGRRRSLTRVCAHLSRELVINDGFVRMDKAEIASALDAYLRELRRTNDAVRLGGDLGIETGADARNVYHNKLMYGDGCPWRDDPSDCSYPARPGVAAIGLYQLSLSFMDAVQSVLERYGLPVESFTDDFLTHPRTAKDGLYDHAVLTYNMTRAERVLKEDPDLPFILDNFDGDLYQGYAEIVRLFDEELSSVVSRAMIDNEAIFAVFVLVTFGGTYFLLFARAVKESLSEGSKARTFVARIPAHVMSTLEVETLSYIFQHGHASKSEM